MSDQKVTGGFSKVRKLISVLEKCNGNSKIGGSEAFGCCGFLCGTLHLTVHLPE